MERTPFTSELPEDDEQETPRRQRRPFEVLSDWLSDRQRMLVEQDDEDEEDEDDSSEGKKRGRIGRALRGLFRKNVRREEITETEEAPAVTIPERSFLGNIIEVDEPVPATAEEAPDEEPAMPVVPVAVPEAPVATIPEDDEDDDPAVTTYPAATTAAPVAGSGSGGSAGGGMPPVAGGGMPGGPPVLGGNIAPTPDPVVIERQPVIEHHHHNRRAALAALVIAERIDHHRNKKRKEQIKELEKAQDKINKKNEERLRSLEQAPVRTPEQPAATYKERPIIPVVPRREATQKVETPEPSRPQSVREVLENRSATKDQAPNLADLEHKPTHQVEQIENDDILVAAEKLAAHAKESGIAHEVFDERWHEIKDPATSLGRNVTAVDDGGAMQGVNAPSTARTKASSAHPAMIDPSTASQQTPLQQKSPTSGLWIALAVGVAAAIMLILTLI